MWGSTSVLAELARSKDPGREPDWNLIRSFNQEYAECMRLQF